MIERALIIIGKKGSGKSVFCDELRKHALVYEMGEIVKEIMKERNIEITNENLRAFMIEERKKHGQEIFAKYTVKKIESDLKNLKKLNMDKNRQKNFIVISGVRSLQELTYFRKKIKNMLIIKIWANDEERFKRMMKRKKEGEPKNYEEFLKQEEKEKEVGIEEVLKAAELVIENNGSLKDFKRKIKTFLKFINIV